MSDAEASAFIREMGEAPLFQPGQWSQIAIAEPQTSQLIGDIGLYLTEDSSYAEIGFTLAKSAQGRGYATAAVEATLALTLTKTSVPKLLGITDARNEASIRLLSRVGMQQIECRQSMFKGESCTELVFCLAR